MFETILALRNAWPIAKSSFFMTYGARNGEKTTTPNRSPLTPGKITLKIKNRVQTPLFQHVVASDGTQIKIEPLLEASGPTVESTMSPIGGVPEEELVQENTTVMSSSTSSGAATTTSSSSSSASTPGPPKKAKLMKN